MYAVTHDPATYAKIDRMIRGYAATLEPLASSIRITLSRLHVRQAVHRPNGRACFRASPCGSRHSGAHHRDRACLTCRPKPCRIRKRPSRRRGFTATWDETYTMPENQFLAWQRTGNPRYRDLAQRFIFHEYFDPLSRGENALPGRHAYSHVNALGSAAMTYLALGDENISAPPPTPSTCPAQVTPRADGVRASTSSSPAAAHSAKA